MPDTELSWQRLKKRKSQQNGPILFPSALPPRVHGTVPTVETLVQFRLGQWDKWVVWGTIWWIVIALFKINSSVYLTRRWYLRALCSFVCCMKFKCGIKRKNGGHVHLSWSRNRLGWPKSHVHETVYGRGLCFLNRYSFPVKEYVNYILGYLQHHLETLWIEWIPTIPPFFKVISTILL